MSQMLLDFGSLRYRQHERRSTVAPTNFSLTIVLLRCALGRVARELVPGRGLSIGVVGGALDHLDLLKFVEGREILEF